MVQMKSVLTSVVVLSLVAQSLAYYDYTQDKPCCRGRKRCSATGDPHFRTFDGEWIHYQGHCTYLLAGVCCNEGWQVYISASACNPWSPNTCVDKVIVKINSYTITMPAGGGMTVSPMEVGYLGYTRSESGGWMRVHTDDGVRIRYNGGNRVYVSIPCKYFNRTCGMCADADGNSGNDYLTSTGGYPTSVDEWGESYQIAEYDSECDDSVSITDPTVDVAQLVAAEDIGECEQIANPPPELSECLGQMEKTDLQGLMEACMIDRAAALRNGVADGGGCGMMETIADMCEEDIEGFQRWVPPVCDVPTPCNPNPCRNGGTCYSARPVNYEYRCDCPDGFTGYHCETRIFATVTARPYPIETVRPVRNG